MCKQFTQGRYVKFTGCVKRFFYQVYIITPPRLAELCDRSFVILSFIRSVREQDNSRMR